MKKDRKKLEKFLGTEVTKQIPPSDELVESINKKIIVEGDGRQLLTD